MLNRFDVIRYHYHYKKLIFYFLFCWKLLFFLSLLCFVIVLFFKRKGIERATFVMSILLHGLCFLFFESWMIVLSLELQYVFLLFIFCAFVCILWHKFRICISCALCVFAVCFAFSYLFDIWCMVNEKWKCWEENKEKSNDECWN